MTFNVPGKRLPPAELERIAPGYYLDPGGRQYFYLTGIYALLTKRITENPVLNSPAFIAGVLDELRQALQDERCVELMDWSVVRGLDSRTLFERLVG